MRSSTRHLAALAMLSLFPALASADDGEKDVPSYAAGTSDELLELDNGVVIEGSDLASPDGYTSGFRITAGINPPRMPLLDLGAEIAYRESDEVPTAMDNHNVILDTISLGGALLAGIDLGRFGLYAKSGFTEWQGDAVTGPPGAAIDHGGTTRMHGFGARWQFERLVSRLEYEEIDAPSMAHLNLITASFHYLF